MPIRADSQANVAPSINAELRKLRKPANLPVIKIWQGKMLLLEYPGILEGVLEILCSEAATAVKPRRPDVLSLALTCKSLHRRVEPFLYAEQSWVAPVHQDYKPAKQSITVRNRPDLALCAATLCITVLYADGNKARAVNFNNSIGQILDFHTGSTKLKSVVIKERSHSTRAIQRGMQSEVPLPPLPQVTDLGWYGNRHIATSSVHAAVEADTAVLAAALPGLKRLYLKNFDHSRTPDTVHAFVLSAQSLAHVALDVLQPNSPTPAWLSNIFTRITHLDLSFSVFVSNPDLSILLSLLPEHIEVLQLSELDWPCFLELCRFSADPSWLPNLRRPPLVEHVHHFMSNTLEQFNAVNAHPWQSILSQAITGLRARS